MKQIFTLVLFALFSMLNVSAEKTRGINNSIRYITLNDGQVIAIPEKYILDEAVINGICTLTLEGDTVFEYVTANVLNISNEYRGEPASISSFVFTHADNDQVYKDVTATITDSGDTIFVNADTNTCIHSCAKRTSLSDLRQFNRFIQNICKHLAPQWAFR